MHFYFFPASHETVTESPSSPRKLGLSGPPCAPLGIAGGAADTRETRASIRLTFEGLLFIAHDFTPSLPLRH